MPSSLQTTSVSPSGPWSWECADALAKDASDALRASLGVGARVDASSKSLRKRGGCSNSSAAISSAAISSRRRRGEGRGVGKC